MQPLYCGCIRLSEFQYLFPSCSNFFFRFTINQVEPEVQTTVVPAQLYKLLQFIFYTVNNMDTDSTPFFAQICPHYVACCMCCRHPTYW